MQNIQNYLVKLAQAEMASVHAMQQTISKLSRVEQQWAPNLSRDGTGLFRLGSEERTPALCEIAVRKNGVALEHVPAEYRTKRICDLAIAQDGAALPFVPEA